MEFVAFALLVFSVLFGFTAIFFTTFGTFIILLGSILYAVMTGFGVFSLKTLSFLLLLYLMGEVLEYVFVIIGAKKLGASNAAIGGALIGGIVGAILGTAFFGTGIFLGTVVGIFGGAFLVELIIHRDLVKSLKAGTGGVLGRAGSVIAKVGIAVIMITVIVLTIAQQAQSV